ncbi:MAG TPA: DUF362 domain-containing protein, partial [Bryobacteraceae bacterium]|nr:DUF362 domain-containing protein [Bryobacteraceae bacterium]
MRNQHTRREWLLRAAAVAAGPGLARAAAAPAGTVAVGKCKTYGAELLPALDKIFDQLGGLGRLVKGKTVAIKLNLTGPATSRVGRAPLGETYWTNPEVIAATVHLMGRAGARRIRLLESPWSTAGPMEEFLLQAEWKPSAFLGAAPRVEFVNTNYRGPAKQYARLRVPFGGYIFPAYDVNRAYEECDVYVSLAKLKEHATAGVTLSMKNNFGIPPASIYGSEAGIDEPNESPKGARALLHGGDRQPSRSAPPEKDPASPRDGGYRVPRIVVDLAAARPIDLAIVEGVLSVSGGEGPWLRNPLIPVSPGVIVAGTNPVGTDAVA